MFLKEKLKLLACLLLALALTGCLDIHQEMWVYEDGRGKLRYQIGLYEQLIMLQGGRSEQICREMYQDKAILEKNKTIQSVKFDSYKQGGIYFCTLELDVSDFTALQSLQDDSIKGGEFAAAKQDFQSEFSLVRRHDDRGFFRQHVRNRAGQAESSRLDIQMGQFANALVGQMMAGRYWTVTLHAPNVRDTNGVLNEDRNTVSWKIPLYDLMVDENYAFDMQARFDVDLPWYKRMWKWIT